MAQRSSSVVEDLTIQPVPEALRTGRVKHLFSFWFTVQIIPLSIVTGLLGPTIFHLDLFSTVLAIVIGNVIGAVFMALHSAQGPTLGVPQMIQARGQFGMYGALLVIVVVILMYVGFFVSLMVLAEVTLVAIFPGLPVIAALALSTALTVVAVIFGYNFIHRINRIMIWLSSLALVITLVFTIIASMGGNAHASEGSFTWTGFLGMASIAGIWQLSYAPYVSDYSRYLPTATSAKSAFWFTYFGTAIGAIGTMSIGAFIIAAAGSTGSLESLSTILPAPLFIFVMLMFFLGSLDAGVINLYGPSLCVLTCIQTFNLKWSPRAMARNITAISIAIVAFLVAVLFSDNFLLAYSNFITLLVYLLVPWSIVNLVDYYLIKKGHYDAASFSDPKSGYGAFNVPAVASYILGFVVQIPFMSTAIYVGPIAKMLGGVDSAWIVGSILTFFIYFALIRLYKSFAPAVAPALGSPVSEKELVS